jgi:hypothetical protein
MRGSASCGSASRRHAVVPFASRVIFAIVFTVFAHSAYAQSVDQYHRTLTVSTAEPVVLDVDVPKGELQILYSHEGEVSVTASAQPSSKTETTIKRNVATEIALDQDGNRIKLRYVSDSSSDKTVAGILYRIDVPYRTAVTANLHDGKLAISGVMGPVHALTGRGDINVSYVSKELVAQAGAGNLDLQVIGARVETKTGNGNISCTRAAQGINAETQEGDITLMVVGAATATVKTGTGRINVGGARGSLLASTDAGELHVKAVPHGDWQLRSASGTVRVELPPGAKFEVDAASSRGDIAVERNDISRSDDPRHLHEAVNGGGAGIQLSTENGRIVIQ